MKLLKTTDATVICSKTGQRMYMQVLPVGTPVRKLRYIGSGNDVQVDFQFCDEHDTWWNAMHWGELETTERQYVVQVCHRAYPSNLQVPNDEWSTVSRCSTPGGALKRYYRELDESRSGNSWTGHARIADRFGRDLLVGYVENQAALLDLAKAKAGAA